MDLHGLLPFLDERSIRAGTEWREKLWQAAWSCRIFIILLSPLFFTRDWPIMELRIALERARRQAHSAADAAGPVTIIPVYVDWTRQQADKALQLAAEHPGSLLQVTDEQGRPRDVGVCPPHPDGPDQQADPDATQLPAGPGRQHAGRQAFSLLQRISPFQQPRAQRTWSETAKEREPAIVAELVREARLIIPRFPEPQGAHIPSPGSMSWLCNH